MLSLIHPREFIPLPRTLSAISLSLLLVAGACLALGQARNSSPSGFAVFSKVETATVPTGMDLTVFCTRPVTPGFTQLKDPERLVIDLPDTLVGSHPQSVPIQTADVKAMRINQFQKSPPVTRIVLDLMGERDYSYEAKDASFVVHLRSAQPRAAKPPSQPAAVVEGTTAIGLPQGAGKGAIILAGSRVAPGSAITAGGDTAILRLERGGEIRICPGTTASVTPSANGRSVMTGMSEGAVELHYKLDSSADTVLTPDFRILLSGPGEFHYAISADPKGNTCVRALQGNTASAVVSELMGDGTYQVKPGEQVVFHSGRLTLNDANVPLECGCPPPRQPQSTAAVPVEAISTRAVSAAPDESTTPVAASTDLKPNSPVMAQVLGAEPPPATKPQVVVDAPFVFRGTDPPPKGSEEAAKRPASSTDTTSAKAKSGKESASTAGQTPAPPAQTQVRKPAQPTTFFGKIRNFFRSIFK
jgi:hypothetical protein